jgi:hypothetical protein
MQNEAIYHLMNSIVFTILSVLLLACVVPLKAETVPMTDNQVVISEKEVRVGPVKADMKLAELKKLIPADDLKLEKVPGPEGSEFSAVILWKGTPRELEVLYDEMSDAKQLTDVRIIGKDWQLPGGLKHGMTIAEVEKINGKAFKVLGFDWDYAGHASFEDGGRLQGHIGVRFDPSTEIDPSLAGDQYISTTNKKLRASGVKVTEITVHLIEQD